MRSNYRKLGPFIRQVDKRNKALLELPLLGVSVQKIFINSIANTVGTDFSKYKIVKRNQFTYIADTSRRGDKIGLAHLQTFDKALVSQAYTVFEIIDHNELDPSYLMMWFRRSEFDRYARFKSHGSVREIFDWEEMCEVELPIPSIEKQRQIVAEYNTVINRIKLNEQLNQKLEETAQALYKHWFVDFNFPITQESCPELVSGSPELEGKPYKSSGGKMFFNEELDKEIPEGWEWDRLDKLTKIEMGQSPKGDTYNIDGIGTPLINGPVEFGDYFTAKTKWTSSPTKLSKKGDLIICVRGSTTGRYVKSDGVYCLGRGVCSFRALKFQRFVDQVYKNAIQELLGLTTGSTFPNWDRQTISSFKVITPLEPILKEFEELVESIFNQNENLWLQNLSLKELKVLILAKMTKVEQEKEITL
jgi:type I restriction enzyme S subunit